MAPAARSASFPPPFSKRNGIDGAAGKATAALAADICRSQVRKVGIVLEKLTVAGMPVKTIDEKRRIGALLYTA